MARRKPAPPPPEPPAAERAEEEPLLAEIAGEVVSEAEGAEIPFALGDDEVIEAEVVADEGDEVPAASTALVPVRTTRLPVTVDPFTRYLQEIRHFRELDPQEEYRLALRYQQTGDREAAGELIKANLKLVVRLALMYRRAIRHVMDLVQEGNVGLLEALKRYDPAREVRFRTFAAWWIKAYMLKFLLDNARMVRVGTTNARRKLIYNLKREKERLAALGVAPTPRLLAERFGVSETDVLEVDRALVSPDLSTDQRVAEDSEITVGERLAAPQRPVDEELAEQEMREKVQRAVNEFRGGLSAREATILDRRLYPQSGEEPATLQELGDEFGITREALRQAESKLKQRLGVFLRERLGDAVILDMTGD